MDKEVTDALGNKYKAVDREIYDGDFIYNDNSKAVALCVAIFSDGDMCVQFMGCTDRAILHRKWYQKAILIQ